nr:immunoglobulin heavy chain junction region [Macaca mulatta]
CAREYCRGIYCDEERNAFDFW